MTNVTHGTARTPRWLLVIFAVGILSTAITVVFSRVQQHHNADSLLYSLISIERWTPFYWGDNRLGTLVPLLASPVRDYRWNLLLQTLVLTICTLGMPIVFRSYFGGGQPGVRPRALAEGCLAVLIGFAIFKPSEQALRMFFLLDPYFLSMLLSLSAVAVLVKSDLRDYVRWLLGTVLLLACFWVAWPMVTIVGGLVLLLPSGGATLRDHVRRRLPALLLTGACFVAVYAFSLLYPRVVIAGFAPPDRWLETTRRLMLSLDYGLVRRNAALTLVLVSLLIALARYRGGLVRRLFRPSDGVAFAAVAIGFSAAVCATEWVILNYYEWRYLTVPVMLLYLVIVSPVLAFVFERLERTVGFTMAALLPVLLLCVVAVRVFGMPSVGVAMESLDQSSRIYSYEVQRLRCTHSIGNYWMTWSTVFYNRTHRREPKLWGIALRARETEPDWSRVPLEQRRYCGLCGDREIEQFRDVYRLPPLRQTGKDANVCLLQH